jgi:KaiC/GvpD/RAD55 family RecA-like ATPase
MPVLDVLILGADTRLWGGSTMANGVRTGEHSNSITICGKHDFGPDFERVVVSCLLGGNGFYTRYRAIIDPEAFKDEELRLLVEIVHAYWDKYHRVPGREVLIELIRQSQFRDRAQLIECLELLDPVEDVTYVQDRMMGWAKWTSIHGAVDRFDVAEDPAEYVSEIRRAASVGDELLMDHTRLDQDDREDETRRPIVPTPWEWLNNRLFGGPELQDLAIVLAFVNVGKTALLVNVAKAAVEQGHHVVYFTFEDGERKIKRRFVQSITGFTREKLLTKPKTARKVKNQWLEESSGRLDIKGLRPRRATVEDAISFVRTLQDAEGRRVSLVVSDYADRFRPPRRRNEERHEYREVYEECKYLALDLEVVHWTASQVQRGRAGAERVGIEHVAESIGKIESADIVVGIGQTRDDEELGQVTMYTAKMRDARKGEMVRLDADFDRQRIQELQS